LFGAIWLGILSVRAGILPIKCQSNNVPVFTVVVVVTFVVVVVSVAFVI